jgi:hypothetical protein
MGNILGYNQTSSYDVSDTTYYKCRGCDGTFPLTSDRYSVKHGHDWEDVCSSLCLAAWQKKHVSSGECCSSRKNLHEKLI